MHQLAKGYSIYNYEKVTSTLDLARKISHKHDGMVIKAIEQTNGIGKSRNVWASPYGNLYITIIIETQTPVHFVFLTTVAIGAILELQNIKYKWPNDILIDQKKIAGILIQNVPGYTLIGVGLNISKAPIEGSTCLLEHRPKIDFPEIQLINSFSRYRQEMGLYGFNYIKQIWMKNALTGNIKIKSQNKFHQGNFHSIDDIGQLVIIDSQGEKLKFDSGEVFNE